jgi:rRNA-processing protein FCF1
MGTKPLRIAADTNVLLDLADEVESVLDAFATIDRRLSQTDKVVTPSVLDELAYLCDSGQSAQVRAAARRSMTQLRQEQRFRALLELPFSSEAIEDIAQEIRRDGLLPREEIHDSRILAETERQGNSKIRKNCGPGWVMGSVVVMI